LIGIVSALREEIAPLVRRTTIQRVSQHGTQRFAAGTLGKREVVLTCAGDGPVRARQGLGNLLERFEIERLLFVGVGGALSPDLEAGDIVVSRSICDRRGNRATPVDSSLLESARKIDRAVAGTIVTVPGIVTDAADKKALWEERGGPQPAVIDMESMTWAAVASERGLPYLVIRSISDTATESLPSFLVRCHNADASLHRGKVIARALGRPLAWSSLYHMRRRLSLCAESLEKFLSRWLPKASRSVIESR
jgi:adenosylhomocysteine nucleosidase